MPASFIHTGYFSVRFTQRDIFHQECSGHAVNVDVRKPVNQQNAAQFFPATAQHLHRHCPFTAVSVGIFPFQQTPVITPSASLVIAVTRNGLQILILRISVSPSDLLTSLSYHKYSFVSGTLLVNGLPLCHAASFLHERHLARSSHFLPIIIPVSLMAYRERYPAIHRFGGFLCLNTPGVSLPSARSLSPARMIRVSGQRFRICSVTFSKLVGSDSRHDPSFSQQTDGKRRGKTLSDNHLFRCFSGYIGQGNECARQLATGQQTFIPVRIDKLATSNIPGNIRQRQQ